MLHIESERAICWFRSRISTMAAKDQVEARSQICPGLPGEWQGQSTGATACCLPRGAWVGNQIRCRKDLERRHCDVGASLYPMPTSA